jgi:hypothetical protein
VNGDVSPIAVLGVPPVGSPQRAAKVATAQKAFYKPIKGDLIGGHFGMNTKIPNIEVIRSLWRRVKKDIEAIRSVWRAIVKKDIEVIRSAWRSRVKKDIKVRDLKPVKDVKGGGGLTGESKPIKAALAPRTPQAHGVMCQKNQILSDAQRTSSFLSRAVLHGLVQSLYHSLNSPACSCVLITLPASS